MTFRRYVLLLILPIAATSFRGAVIETLIPCPDFTNPSTGIAIKGGTVMTYNTVTQNITLRVGREIKTLPLSILPDSVRERVKQLPLPAETPQRIATQKRQADAATDARVKRTMQREARIEKEALDEARDVRRESRRLTVKKSGA